ncbi:alpha/beta hydrolase [Nitratireductor soli]|uniref:alpha/beta hydrolase n=1 Tax=Nitratireductor soli TaxID=1670619 RepID=UPI00065E59E5|nr:alpha/beta hydrolase [Nitratireductor soli]
MNTESDSTALHDEALSSAMDETARALPGETLQAIARSGLSATTGSHVVFECEMRGGAPVPLKRSDSESALWREIASALRSGTPIGTGLVLERHLALVAEMGTEHPARVLAMPDKQILNKLQAIAPGGQISASELRLLKHLICGATLSEAASRDGVSHETKRSQFKSLSRKLGVRSQNELANKVLMHILLAPDMVENGTAVEPSDYFIDLTSEFMPFARTLQLWSKSGTKHRFVDLGPVSGRPAALVHSYIIADIRPDDIAFLHKHGVRLIVPLRNGAMARGATSLDVAAHLDHACEGIDLVRTHFCGERIDLFLDRSGCIYGIEYGRRWPERVASAAFVGACVRPINDTSKTGRLRAAMFSQALKNWKLFSLMMNLYTSRMRRPDVLRKFLDEMYQINSADLAILKVEYSSSHGGERGRKFLTSSAESVKHDFYHQARPRWEQHSKGAFPAAFLHGDQDFIHPIEEVRALAKSFGGVPLHTIPGAGQLIYHQHFAPLVAAYAGFLAQRA